MYSQSELDRLWQREQGMTEWQWSNRNSSTTYATRRRWNRESLTMRPLVISAAAAGVILFGGGIVEGTLDNSDLAPPSEIQAQMDDYEQKTRFIEDTTAELETTMGEACLPLVMRYTPGGDLEGTEEGEVVDDILRFVDQPCGEDPANARWAYREATAVVEAEDSIAEVDFNQLTIDLAQSEDEYSQDNRFNYMVWPLALPMLGGPLTVFGLLKRETRQHNRRVNGA